MSGRLTHPVRAAGVPRPPCVPRLYQPCMIGARPTRPWHSTRRPWHNTRRPWHALRGFTLVELLVTITIISILAGVTLGALHAARQTAREAKTKSLITRLDQIIMQRYESYLIRRVPISTSGLPPATAAELRLSALRELMRRELPERWTDVADPSDLDLATPGLPMTIITAPLPTGTPVTRELSRPSLSRVYLQQYQNSTPPPTYLFSQAECLYMIISTGSAGAMEQFSESDIGDADNDGWREFHDGWGRPICLLRWAPGFSYGPPYNGPSAIQSGDPVADHDPFDTRNVRPGAFRLIPLIYSAGPDKQSDINVEDETYVYSGDPYAQNIGAPLSFGRHHDNIHNHYIEQR